MTKDKMIQEIKELQESISEYRSIIGDLYEEIEFYENCIKRAESEIEDLNTENK